MHQLVLMRLGFPGETEEQFENTLVADIGYQLTLFAASRNPAVWENQLSEEVKSDRLQRLNWSRSKQVAITTLSWSHRRTGRDQNPKPQSVTDGG